MSAALEPDGVELSPLGDRRNHPVPCQGCRRPTLNYSARCNGCRAANQKGTNP